ncbi:glycosyltransferase family 4 protein [Nitratiruptor sp. YY09-18]|uniref:glycosyltransferase family 4 protein n=1 Tax=Nitratiruptor sp. YY09-18 TaxID=2724901 RepID=UPI00191589D1|nr:glycosyltransferase family 4 protein [Nitratiruptor sp. YY09-18]BCD67952.1 hypothetical protein NitYY0918_C0860 [Nitratiruptor sp. YY09-18]
MKNKVCHITTVHQPFDIRIFHKECLSLTKAGYDVNLIAQHDRDETINGVKIVSLPKIFNRKERIFKLRKLAFQKAVEIDADIYHFHDPELLPVGLKLKKLGRMVIYDVHEDVPRQILSKPYLNKFIKPIISKSFEIYENRAAKKFDAIITATPHIRNRFLKINSNTVDINNYPKLNELYEPVEWINRKNEICYIGGITKIRGIIELIKALEYTDTILHLAGNFESKELEKEVKSLPGWKKVKYYGFVGREKVNEILKLVKIGIVTLHPITNYIYSQPIKMFEYMSAGIPVIASNFSLWKEIVEKGNCGICVDPLSPKEIANAINNVLGNDKIAKNMGENGRKLVENKYNWKSEEKKLFELYIKIIEKNDI